MGETSAARDIGPSGRCPVGDAASRGTAATGVDLVIGPAWTDGAAPTAAVRVSTGAWLSTLSGTRARSSHDETSTKGDHRATEAGTVTTTGSSSLSGTRRNRP